MRIVPPVVLLLFLAVFIVGCDETTTQKPSSPKSPLARNMFTTMDADGDGEVTEVEHKQFQEVRYDVYDADNDGSVTEEEFVEAVLADFDAADADNDDSVTVEEMVRCYSGIRYNSKDMDTPDGEQISPLIPKKPWGDRRADTDEDGQLDRRELARVFASMHRNADANGDGRVTREEFVPHMQRIFKKMDADRNGRLLPNELL